MGEAGQARAVGAGIYNGGNFDTLGLQVLRRAQPVVIVGEDGGTLPHGHAPAVGIGAQGTRKQDAGPVIVFKGNGPLDGPAAQDRAARIDAPQHLARLAGQGFCQMVRYAFHGGIDAMVERAQNGGARQKPHLRHLRQLCHGLRRPVGPGLGPQHKGLGVQPSAHAEILVGQDHPCAAAPGGQGGSQARRPRPDDQQVAMQEPLVIGVRVILHRQCAQSRSAADQRLINLFPERGRPHEGLVVEARRKER